MKKRVLYSVANYAAIVRENGYFVDKTAYIAKLEAIKNPVFLRPRRFGKSLLCSMLRYYYDLNYEHRFAELFGHTWIGQHPTENHNHFIVLSLNFSVIEVGPTIDRIEHSFKRHCNNIINLLRDEYVSILGDMPEVIMDDAVSDNLNTLLHHLRAKGLPPVYIIIDEYDNFANQLVTANKDDLYNALTADDGFLKTFFKTLKEGRESDAITGSGLNLWLRMNIQSKLNFVNQ